MPISIRNVPPDESSKPLRRLAFVPAELYFRLGFHDLVQAREWAEQAVAALGGVELHNASHLDRIIVWGPRRQPAGIAISGEGYVFVSELALRCLRALEVQSIPVPELVSLVRLERGLEMLQGEAIDQRAYDRWVMS
jgi:hypothetical protein